MEEFVPHQTTSLLLEKNDRISPEEEDLHCDDDDDDGFDFGEELDKATRQDDGACAVVLYLWHAALQRMDNWKWSENRKFLVNFHQYKVDEVWFDL
jgi:hypothetical protein